MKRVPAWIVGLLAASLAAQLLLHGLRPAPLQARQDLPPAPSAQALRIASLGEDAAAARLTMLYLQGFDLRGLDYARLTAWLRAALALDPRSGYPLFAAARVFAETPRAADSRAALELVYEEFLRDPDRRWPWLAHAALLAKHRLQDLPLARRYAAAIERHARAPDIPLWAKQMEVFILEDMNELEAARIVLGGLLERGDIRDPNELRFLRERLRELEQRAGGGVK